MGLRRWSFFVQTSRIESVLVMSKQFSCRPSDIMHINDEYLAFCFDEVCSYIMTMLLKGEKPCYKTKRKNDSEKEPKHFSTMKSFYESLERG